MNLSASVRVFSIVAVEEASSTTNVIGLSAPSLPYSVDFQLFPSLLVINPPPAPLALRSSMFLKESLALTLEIVAAFSAPTAANTSKQ